MKVVYSVARYQRKRKRQSRHLNLYGRNSHADPTGLEVQTISDTDSLTYRSVAVHRPPRDRASGTSVQPTSTDRHSKLRKQYVPTWDCTNHDQTATPTPRGSARKRVCNGSHRTSHSPTMFICTSTMQQPGSSITTGMTNRQSQNKTRNRME